jgi:hypothetical protein
MKRRMNHSLLVALLALSCGAAFAQAPAGTVEKPAQETAPAAAGGKPAAKAEAKTEAKKGETSTMGAGPAKMDANGDGSITKAEWDNYHSAMWKKMNKNGKVSTADADAMMKGGPN